MKAVENGGTSVGIRCKDGVVLAVEKIVTSKLLKPGANKRIATVDRHLGVVSFSSPRIIIIIIIIISTPTKPWTNPSPL